MSDEYLRTLQNLVELFPTMDREVIDIVLRDNGGSLEPSMTALLSMNDPEYKQDQQEVDRQEGLKRDAEFARKLVEKELTRNANTMSRTTSGRRKGGRRRYTDGENVALPMHNVAGLNGLTTTTSSWQHPSSSSQPKHDKKPSKIRNIFKFGGHSSSQHKKEDGNSSDQNQPTQLDSDFSDSSARSQPQQQPMERRRPAPLKQPQKTDNEDVFGLFDDNNDGLSSYAPLSPSKHVPKSPPPAAALPADDRETTAVDLEHPFGLSPPSQTLELQHGDDTPVMQQTQTSAPQSPKHSNNPFLDQPIQIVDDTNPFRARNKNLQ